MATVLVCRRLPRLSRATPFSSTATRGGGTGRPRKEEEPAATPPGRGSGATIQLLNPLGYRVPYNPSAYAKSGVTSPARSSSRAPGDDFTRPGAARGGDTFGAASSPGLPPVRNALPEPEPRQLLPGTTSEPRQLLPGTTSEPKQLLPGTTSEPKQLLPQTVSARSSAAQSEEGAEDGRKETYDSKEDPRVFQKGRPEYRSLSYDSSEPLEPLPVEEGEQILGSVGERSPGALAEGFCQLSRLPPEHRAGLASREAFQELWRGTVRGLGALGTLELLEVLKACVRLSLPASHPLLDACEEEFCRRAWDMGLEQLLLVADCWRCLGRSTPSYLSILFSYADVHWKELTLPQFVQLLYIVGEGRRTPADLTRKMEAAILKHLDSFTLEELGAVSLGLFKSLSGISERVARRMADRVALQMEEMSTYALVNVLKVLRYARLGHRPLLRELGRVIPPRIPTTNIQGVMHVALTCSSLHYFDEGILAAVAQSLPSKVSYCRSKDAAKFLWSFGCLDYEPPNEEEFYSSLIGQMHRKLHEFKKFPEHLLTGLLGLAFVRRFPEELIDYALRDEFVQMMRGSKYELKKDLFTLGRSVEIECPGYRGSRLPPHLYQEFTEMALSFAEQEIYVRPEIVEATSLLESMLGGPQYVRNHMILPHTRSSDLEVRLAGDGRPLPFNCQDPLADKKLKDLGVSLTDELMAQLLQGSSAVGEANRAWTPAREGAGRRAALPGGALPGPPLGSELGHGPQTPSSPALHPPAGEVKLALQVSNRNHHCYCSRRLLGLHGLKRRQLRRLGYVVVELPFWEWFPLLRRTRLEKLSYLHSKVFDPALLGGAG